MNQARNTARALEDRVPGLGEFFDKMAEAGHDAHFIRLMDIVGAAMGESGAMRTDPRTAMTPREARDRIMDIRNNPEHPANNDDAHGHERARRDLMELYKIANMG